MKHKCRSRREGDTVRYVRGDRESWSAAIVLPNRGQSSDEALAESGAYNYYHGPGRSFAGEPYVDRTTRTRILVRWSGGLDI
jgi:hypothetical protein